MACPFRLTGQDEEPAYTKGELIRVAPSNLGSKHTDEEWAEMATSLLKDNETAHFTRIITTCWVTVLDPKKPQPSYLH